jgi:flagellar motor switch protein FliN
VSDDSKSMRQDEVEQLLSLARQGGGPAPTAAPKAAEEASGALDQAAIEQLLAKSAANQPAAPPKPAPPAERMVGLLDQATEALASVDQPVPLPPGVKPFELKSLAGSAVGAQAASLNLLRDVQLDLKIELGRTHMHLEEVLKLKKGAVVTLDKLAGDPVDLFVNGRLIARGEVLVLNDNFCVRVAELIASESAAA